MSADLNRQPPALTVAAARLAEMIHRARPGSGWLRLEQPVCVETDLLSWLAAGQGVRIYWAERDDASCEAAGIGEALVLKVEHSEDLEECQPVIQDVLESCPASRFYGGLAFFEGKETQWPGFGGGELILPRFELVRKQHQLTLACHLDLPCGSAGEQLRCHIAKQALALTVSEVFPMDLPQASIVRETPNWPLWQTQVGNALKEMNAGKLEKLVLSREQQLVLKGELCPWSMLSIWRKLTPETYRFAFCTKGGQCFFGASPERLYRRQALNLDSEALAGTAPRGQTPAQDRRLAATLLADDKNRRENSLVLQAVRYALQSCSDSIEPASDMNLIRLRNVQHLRQLVRARLKPGTSDAELLKLLHPTPAVGGVPKALALDLLAQYEKHERGWYAAPFGCIGKGCAEFAVAIRCVFLNGQTLSLYSGAGLVPGSDAGAEWAELDSKLRTVQSLLHVIQ